MLTRKAVERIAEIAAQEGEATESAPRASRRRRGATAEAAEEAVEGDAPEATSDSAATGDEPGDEAE